MTEIMVGASSELADGDYRIVAVGELEVGIFRLGERFVAYENRCPHHGGPVCQGKLFNRVEEIIMPDRPAAVCASPRIGTWCVRGTATSSISTPAAIPVIRGFACGRYRCAWRTAGSTSRRPNRCSSVSYACIDLCPPSSRLRKAAFLDTDGRSCGDQQQPALQLASDNPASQKLLGS